jgi:hypothetical protein
MYSALSLYLHCLLTAVAVALCFAVPLLLKSEQIWHLREMIRLGMTHGGQVQVTEEEAAEVIKHVHPADFATYLAARKPMGCAKPCHAVSRDLQGLNAVLRANDYRTTRAS